MAGLVGLGALAKAAAAPEWGASPFQARPREHAASRQRRGACIVSAHPIMTALRRFIAQAL